MLPPIDHPLALSSTATAAPFSIATPRSLVHGTERDGIHQVRLDGTLVAQRCSIRTAEANSFRITPLGVARTLRVCNVDIRETIVAAPHEPGFAVQWVADEDVEVEIDAALEPAAPARMLLSDREIGWPAGARLTLRQGEGLTLITGAERASHADPGSWVRLHRAAQQRRAHELLHAAFADPLLDVAFEWAKYRVTTGRSEQLSALLALGDFSGARLLLEQLPPAGRVAALGRYAAATADDALVRRHWSLVRELYRELGHTLGAEALRTLGHTAESVGDAELTAWLAQRARSLPAEPVGALNHAAAEPAGTWDMRARACFEGELGAWADPAGAANVITGFVHELLGIEVDAARMRLRLQPRIPAGWPRLGVHNIAIGDARVGIAFERTGRRQQFSIAQTAGAMPARAVVTLFSETPPTAAHVDGVPATLAVVRSGEGYSAPLQIMLDAERVVELQG